MYSKSSKKWWFFIHKVWVASLIETERMRNNTYFMEKHRGDGIGHDLKWRPISCQFPQLPVRREIGNENYEVYIRYFIICVKWVMGWHSQIQQVFDFSWAQDIHVRWYLQWLAFCWCGKVLTLVMESECIPHSFSPNTSALTTLLFPSIFVGTLW